MHATKTIEDRDLEKCLNDCQQRQYPYAFWDEKEVAGFNLGSLPRLLTGEIPAGWRKSGGPRCVNLSKGKSISAFKAEAENLILGHNRALIEVGFAITSINGSEVEIQIYIK